MADVPTQQDLFLAGRREALLQPTRFAKAIIDTEGSDVHVVLQSSAAMGEEVARYLQSALNDLALATARGEALDRWVFDRYQLRRQEATPAVVTLTLTRSDTSFGFTVPKGSKFGTQDGVVFVTQVDVPFAEGEGGPLEVLATSEKTGTTVNVAAGTITQVLTPQEDPTLAVTNDEPAAGGAERESDADFRARAREFFVTARRGTLRAIEFGGTSTPGVSKAKAVEVFQIETGLPGYRVTLHIADSEGQANKALADAVERNLDEYRALGVPVLVTPAVPQYVQIVAEGLQFEAGANTQEVLQQASNAVLALVNGLAPSATLRRSDLLAALSQVPQLVVPNGALKEPAGDLVPSTGTVLRTTRDRISLKG